VIFEPPAAWDPDEADDLAAEAGALASRDPLAHGLSRRLSAYYRLPVPRGTSPIRRSRDRTFGRHREESKHKDAAYVFTNVDMFADAKRFKKAMKL